MLNKISPLLKKEYLILYLIILIGAFLRLQGIFTNSFAFTYDVGRDMLALWDMQNLQKISLIGPTSGLPGVFYGPWWYLMLFPFFVMTAGNPQLLTLVIALSGVSTILLAFIFGRKLGGIFLGLIFASLISVSSALASLSSQIWSPNIVPIFIMFALICLYKIYSKKFPRQIYFFLLGFLLALGSESGIVFGFLFLLGIILSLTYNLRKRFTFKSIVLFFLGIFAVFSPRIIFEFRHQFLMTKSLINFLMAGDSSGGFDISRIVVNRINILFNNFNTAIAYSNNILGIIVILFIFFTLIAFFRYANETTKKFISTSLIVLTVFLVGTIAFKHDIWPHYLVGLPVFYILLFSISVSLISQKTNNNLLPGLIVIVVFLINLNPIYLINNLSKPLWVGDASVYRNQLAVIDYVYNEAKGKEFKYVVYTPPVHDYIYKYLFRWYGSNKYSYLPSGTSHLAYFILEPDLQYPSRLADWLKLREKDGEIIKIEQFRSGIIVQTRIH
ncbi:MAG: hypothetical protein Q8P20_08075 [bacterium]|nr:hypothetical protein [bacterium]